MFVDFTTFGLPQQLYTLPVAFYLILMQLLVLLNVCLYTCKPTLDIAAYKKLLSVNFKFDKNIFRTVIIFFRSGSGQIWKCTNTLLWDPWLWELFFYTHGYFARLYHKTLETTCPPISCSGKSKLAGILLPP